LALGIGDLPIAACRLALAQDDDLALGYDRDAIAVARPKACGQALKLGQGRSSQTPLQAVHAGGRALAPPRPRPVTGLHQLHPGEDLLSLSPSSTTARLPLEQA
jgi:hypothetical protein